jgi:predicted small lipoprotein YifL
LIIGSNQRWIRLAAVGALVAALGLSACGRKGPLDPPPAAAVPPPMPVVSAVPDGPIDALGPDGRPMPLVVAPPERKSFILDWLIN